MNNQTASTRFFQSLIIVVYLAGSLFVRPVSAQETSTTNRGVEKVSADKDSKISFYDKSRALIVVNSEYSFWPKLKGAESDAPEVEKILREHGFEVEVERNLTSATMKPRIEQFLKRYGQDNPNTRLLIYYAGHGATEETSEGKVGYILPVDTPNQQKNPTEFRQTALEMGEIANIKLQAKHTFFVFDSCFSGALVSGMRSAETLPASIEVPLSKSVKVFMTSGSENQAVPDESYFRRKFVEALQGEADFNCDGYVTGQELSMFISALMADRNKFSLSSQTPQFNRQPQAEGDIVFKVIKTRERCAEKPADITTAQCVAAYEEVDKNNQQHLKNFVSKYSTCYLASSATARIKELEAGGATLTRLSEKPFEFTAFGGEKSSRNSVEVDLGDGVKLRLVEIPAGKFKMGSELMAEEGPVREVAVPKFFLAAFEVSVEQWLAVVKMPKQEILLSIQDINPKDKEMPVVNITWDEAEEFCRRLSKATGRQFALPTEAQWEYAARAAAPTTFFSGERISPTDANFDATLPSNYNNAAGQRRDGPASVTSFKFANKLGLFNMHGNVREWVLDSWKVDYRDSPTDGSAYRGVNPLNKTEPKVVRGGSFLSAAPLLRPSYRSHAPRQTRAADIGFRVVMLAQ
jgi:formylglycine-generating enzyme required for sulfatase activity